MVRGEMMRLVDAATAWRRCRKGPSLHGGGPFALDRQPCAARPPWAFPPCDFQTPLALRPIRNASLRGRRLFLQDERRGISWNRFVPVLANENHERYSRLRAILVPPRAAVKAIGLKPSSGVATKLEQNEKIRERIAELVGDEVEVLREKRQQIESALSAIAYGDGSEFPGKRIAVDWPNRLGAIAQLRDMHGFKSVTKTALTDPTGEKPASVYLIADKPMTEAQWEAERASAAGT